jgi:GH24 family phage-related lysozyme (muramidase)
MNDALNKSLIQKHEGCRLEVYRDTRGIQTIGYGFNLETTAARNICIGAGVDYDAVLAGAAITSAQADAIFERQYQTVAAQARISIPAIDEYAENLGAVVCDMIFNLGWAGFMAFRQTIAAVKEQDIPAVIQGIKDSALATQVPHRVADNIALLEAIPS